MDQRVIVYEEGRRAGPCSYPAEQTSTDLRCRLVNLSELADELVAQTVDHVLV